MLACTRSGVSGLIYRTAGHMTSSLAGSERDRRHSCHRARSMPDTCQTASPTVPALFTARTRKDPGLLIASGIALKAKIKYTCDRVLASNCFFFHLFFRVDGLHLSDFLEFF